MDDKPTVAPESSAVRTALWRAMHVQVDSSPHVLEDEMGWKLAAPDDGWRDRQDMHPHRTRRFPATQSQLSKIESGNDHLLSTPRRYVKCLGGELEVIARFGDKSVRPHGV